MDLILELETSNLTCFYCKVYGKIHLFVTCLIGVIESGMLNVC